MNKFRKRPVVIEAQQWTGRTPVDGVAAVAPHPPWSDWTCPRCHKPSETHGCINTLEGSMWACIGDWIITGVKGERYPCKPDVFAATYEPMFVA